MGSDGPASGGSQVGTVGFTGCWRLCQHPDFVLLLFLTVDRPKGRKRCQARAVLDFLWFSC